MKYPIPKTQQDIAHRARLLEGLHSNILAFLIAAVVTLIITTGMHLSGSPVTRDVWFSAIGTVFASAICTVIIDRYWNVLIRHVTNLQLV